MEGRDSLHGSFLGEIAPHHLVDLVHLDCADEQRLPAFQIAGEAPRPRTVGEVFDPTARVDEDQSRSFFSRRPRVRVPCATPRYARIDRCGTRKITPPLLMTVNLMPGRR